jgi:uncharacterized protein YjiS (DUF1127 family)
MAEDGVINAEAIYHELEKLGYAGSARSVRRFVEGLRPTSRPGRALGVLPLVQRIRALDRNFPRHYREQCRAVLALARKTDRNILIEAARRLLDHDCVSYGNLKKAVAYLEDQGTLPLVDAERPPGRLPGDLGLEPRSADYYDELLEVKR